MRVVCWRVSNLVVFNIAYFCVGLNFDIPADECFRNALNRELFRRGLLKTPHFTTDNVIVDKFTKDDLDSAALWFDCSDEEPTSEDYYVKLLLGHDRFAERAKLQEEDNEVKPRITFVRTYKCLSCYEARGIEAHDKLGLWTDCPACHGPAHWCHSYPCDICDRFSLVEIEETAFVCERCQKPTKHWFSIEGPADKHYRLSTWRCDDCLVRCYQDHQWENCSIELELAGNQAEVHALLKRLAN